MARTGDIWFAYLDPGVGHEQGGRRPVVVISSDSLHEITSNLAFIVPMTGRDRQFVTHVKVELSEGNLLKDSFAMTEQLRSISRLRLRRRVGSADQRTMDAIRRNVLWFMDFDAALAARSG